MAFDLNGLTAYVDEQKLALIGKSVLSSKSVNLFNLQTGVKGSAAINIGTAVTPLQNGASCGFTASGSNAFSQRIIQTAPVKVNKTYCQRDLEQYWMNYQTKIAAGKETLPFEQFIVNQEIENVGTQLETLAWQGDTGSGDLFDGVLAVLAGEAYITGNTGSYSAITVNNVIAIVDLVYSEIPEEILDKNDTVIFMGADVFRKYTIALKNADMFNYVAGSADLANQELIIPGTLIKMVAVNGLNNTGVLVACQKANIYYGCDLQTDSETFDLWFSQDNRDYRLEIRFNAGIQVAFPDQIVLFELV